MMPVLLPVRHVTPMCSVDRIKIIASRHGRREAIPKCIWNMRTLQPRVFRSLVALSLIRARVDGLNVRAQPADTQATGHLREDFTL
jgi:hypothetical protein